MSPPRPQRSSESVPPQEVETAARLVRVEVPLRAGGSKHMSPEQLIDAVVRARAGDEKAWESLVRGLSGAVYRALASYGFPSEVREEVFQETFVKLVEHLDKIKEPLALPKWLMVCADNQAKNYLRRKARVFPVATVPEVDDSVDVDVALLSRESRNAVYLGFQRLNPICQDLLRLLTVDPPLTYAEIAARLGRSHGDIGPTRRRCLDKLRQTPEVVAILGSASEEAKTDER